VISALQINIINFLQNFF